jgi:hypothetical protein
MMQKTDNYDEEIASKNLKIFEDESTVDVTDEQKITASSKRAENFDSWFEGGNTDKLLENADEKGPILDFAVVGYSKCILPLVANLAEVAAMPVSDTCTPPHQTVYYAYKNWPTLYGENKPLKGTSCGVYMASGQTSILKEWSKHLPRTKLIIGITHPMTWFKAFWDHLSKTGYIEEMTDNSDPYELTKPCVESNCRNSCPKNQLFCVHRARFHLGLAKLGKTPLTDEERELLAPDDEDGGTNIVSDDIKNPIFVYDEGELKNDYAWEGLADFLGVESIDHLKRTHKMDSVKTIESLDFCDEKYDDLRSMIMSTSYDLGVWLQTHFLSAAMDKSRPDVRVSNPTQFSRAVEYYKSDPCGILVRAENGTFVVQPK